MQSWIVHKSFKVSASLLEWRHLRANIYENIHILASLLGINDLLVNPKKDVSNHPVAKLWKGYEKFLFKYIYWHLDDWFERYPKPLYLREKTVNYVNYEIVRDKYNIDYGVLAESFIIDCDLIPDWVSDQLIATHKNILIKKEIEREAADQPLKSMCFTEYRKKYRFYRDNWGDNFNSALPMRYDWRENKIKINHTDNFKF